MTLLVSTLLFIALFRFIKIVRSLKHSGYNLATKRVVSIMVTLVAWSIGCIYEEVFLVGDYGTLDNYESVVRTTRFTTVTLYLDFVQFLVLAYMLYSMNLSKLEKKTENEWTNSIISTGNTSQASRVVHESSHDKFVTK